jgi:hypothetical protein
MSTAHAVADAPGVGPQQDGTHRAPTACRPQGVTEQGPLDELRHRGNMPSERKKARPQATMSTKAG